MTNSTYSHRCILPTNISSRKALQAFTDHKLNKAQAAKCFYFLDTLTRDVLSKKNSFKQFTPLNTKTLEYHLGTRHTKRTIQILEDAEIIEVQKNIDGNDAYRVGHYSKSYRLGPTAKRSFKVVNSLLTDRMSSKIHSFTDNKVKSILKVDKYLLHEIKQLSRLRIDVEAATAHVNKFYKKGSDKHAQRILSIQSIYDLQFNKVEGTDIDSMSFGTSISYKYGRLYTPYTSLAKDLERYTYFEGEEREGITTLDMPNSQPTFFVHTALNSDIQNTLRKVKTTEHNSLVYMGSSYFKYIDDNYLNLTSIDDDKDGLLVHDDIKNTILSLNTIFRQKKNFATRYRLTEEEKQKVFSVPIYDISLSGYFYEVMMLAVRWKGKDIGHTPDERTAFKKFIFEKIFYGAYRKDWNTTERKIYKHYPGFIDDLRTIKKHLSVTSRNEKGRIMFKDGNKRLAQKVQRTEGRLFHSTITEMLKAVFPSVPFVIKHDSVTLPKQYEDAVKPYLNAIIKDYFNSELTQMKCEYKNYTNYDNTRTETELTKTASTGSSYQMILPI